MNFEELEATEETPTDVPTVFSCIQCENYCLSSNGVQVTVENEAWNDDGAKMCNPCFEGMGLREEVLKAIFTDDETNFIWGNTTTYHANNHT